MAKGNKKRVFHKKKTYKVDFFVVTHGNDHDHNVLRELLKAAKSGFTTAVSLVTDEDEKYMVRSIVPVGKSVFKGVFGRCRFGETPLQGTEKGDEAEVQLKPGHGLVEKNHFLFFADRNLLLYQRNPSGSHHGRFQRYLNLVIDEQRLALEPILTTDAYKRLIEGGDARIIDVSFRQPKDPALYEDLWLKDAVKLTKDIGGINARVRISVGRTTSKLTKIKNAVVTMAKGGFATVARVRLEDEAEPIDLIADRIIESITVDLNEHGRPDSEEIYAALQQAELDRAKDLKTFYGA